MAGSNAVFVGTFEIGISSLAEEGEEDESLWQ
jgi:hypothetical protein